mmetsp:Transcript_14610/g.35302  ORF Transcript_14610/g.35302 Transcript_14610/m.35302 type:complete len:209 (+) Transcript_14610:75-701(+)
MTQEVRRTLQKRTTGCCLLRHVVQLGVLGVEGADVEARVQLGARHRLAQLVRRRVQRPHAVHLVLQPLPDGSEGAGGHQGVKALDLLLRLGVELARVHGAQGVGGEVSERSVRPVHVLQHAQLVGLRHHPKQLLHLVLPQLRQVRHLRRAPEDGALDLEPQHHVHAVRQLVGVHADEPGARLVDEAVQVVGAHRVLGVRELFMELGEH